MTLPADLPRASRRAFTGWAAATLAMPAIAQPADAAAASIADAVARAYQPLMATHDVPGLAVGVSARGRRHQFHFGVASRQSNAPVTAHTLFEIGSLSKTFTATLAALAHERGRLSLTDPPSRHLPALAGTPIDRATLMHLGTYSAGGLPLQFPASVADEPDAIAYCRQFVPTAAPGTQRRYSNPSIGLFGQAAAKALGRPFAQACEIELFPALGLRDTFLQVPQAELARYAWGHDASGREIRVNPGVFDAQAYGVKCTAGDLLAFVEAQLRPAPLARDLQRAIALTQTGFLRCGPLVQGLGWEQYPWPVTREQLLVGNGPAMVLEPQPAQPLSPPAAPAPGCLYNKTGSTNGFGAYAAFIPSRALGVVMLANRNVPVPARVAATHALLTTLDGLA